MDVGMPGLSSFEAVRQIRKNSLVTRVLFLTMYDDEEYVMEYGSWCVRLFVERCP